LDCLAFDERLRCGDTLLDIAFLAMDVERLGSPSLASTLLERYCEFTNASHPRSLTDFYIAYRALVRAKVNLGRDKATQTPVALRENSCGSVENVSRRRYRCSS
jgi:aminoglycoside phosphotransferase family enzyme